MPDPWVMDTSVFTHWHRAGRGEILRRVSPGGQVILIPDAVNAEVEVARTAHSGIPAIADCEWVELVVLSPDEGAEQLAIQFDMGAESPGEHAGEAAVIAYAHAHNCTAIVDEKIVDDLLATDMWLPLKTGASLHAWAWRRPPCGTRLHALDVLTERRAQRAGAGAADGAFLDLDSQGGRRVQGAEQ